MKGIILAGGSGTRLYPITKAISKQLLPIYDKPMIYYPLSTLMLAGIRQVLIITNGEFVNLYKDLLGDGSELGMSITYKVQDKPRGIADAFIVGEEFIDQEPVALVLGDNIFYGQGFRPMLEKAASITEGAVAFGYYVDHPEEFGVVEFDENEIAISLEEKPANPKSNWVISGLYFYDHHVVELAKSLKPSDRGELEITDLNQLYLEKKQLKIELLERGFAWLDTGTYEGLLEAAEFVRTIQKRQGMYVSSIEEIAYRKNYITKEQLKALGETMSKTDYGQYLIKIAK